MILPIYSTTEEECDTSPISCSREETNYIIADMLNYILIYNPGFVICRIVDIFSNSV